MKLNSKFLLAFLVLVNFTFLLGWFYNKKSDFERDKSLLKLLDLAEYQLEMNFNFFNYHICKGDNNGVKAQDATKILNSIKMAVEEQIHWNLFTNDELIDEFLIGEKYWSNINQEWFYDQLIEKWAGFEIPSTIKDTTAIKLVNTVRFKDLIEIVTISIIPVNYSLGNGLKSGISGSQNIYPKGAFAHLEMMFYGNLIYAGCITDSIIIQDSCYSRKNYLNNGIKHKIYGDEKTAQIPVTAYINENYGGDVIRKRYLFQSLSGTD